MEEKPDLQPGLEVFLHCFYDLDSCRGPAGMGVGRIPYTAAHEWCDREGVCSEFRESVWYHIKGLDTVYLDHINRQNQSASKKRTPSASQPKKRRIS